jgi:hypothetical protein
MKYRPDRTLLPLLASSPEKCTDGKGASSQECQAAHHDEFDRSADVELRRQLVGEEDAAAANSATCGRGRLGSQAVLGGPSRRPGFATEMASFEATRLVHADGRPSRDGVSNCFRPLPGIGGCVIHLRFSGAFRESVPAGLDHDRADGRPGCQRR